MSDRKEDQPFGYPGEVFPDEPLTGSSPGKRSRTDEPLTEHDVAERLDRAVMRVVRIMFDVRENMPPEMVDLVKRSRYTTNALYLLADELVAWGVRSTKEREAADAIEAADDLRQAMTEEGQP
jgi:hypothetical protein